ncbi:hypothetical protein CBW65_08890 [Tumebacillus avium]|uniref:HTH cro/C1-type domain-containing protein n=1 Tax=Tumebacillus avium TaxID=1903704 RepID=A0A1Y0IP73_9BACL|nr:helix-turn-helix transcriptional regulator [Tumebacillus avium]ARU61133.1 hypothetical protein CBW65_08890 [Tumebacillus avium]
MLVDFNDTTIGQRFKIIRTDKGFSQAELAEGICSTSVISQIECDRKYPSAETLGKLAEKLSVPLREIMGMQEKQMDVAFQIELVRVHLERTDHSHALILIQELERSTDLLEHQRVSLLYLRAECLIQLSQFDVTCSILIPFIEQQQIQQSIEDEMLCDLYNKLGTAFFKLRDFEKAFSAYEQGYRVSLRLNHFGLIPARVTKNLGLTCNQLGFKKEASRYLEKAYAFYSSVSDMKGMANTLFALAIATGDAERLKLARSTYESLNLVYSANVVKQHYAYHVESKRDYRKAVDDLVAVASEFEKVEQTGMAIYTLSRAVMVCIDHTDIELAELIMRDATIKQSKMDVEDNYMMALYYRSKARYCLETGLLDECVAHSEKSAAMYGIIGMSAEAAESLQLAVSSYQRQGQIEKALVVLKRSYDLLKRSGDIE